LKRIGFRFLPTLSNAANPYWTDMPLPSCIQPFIWDESKSPADIRYLLTFRPFSLLPNVIKRTLSERAPYYPAFPG